MKKLFVIAGLSISLSACAAPPALQLISFAVDGISYIATDKTIADHGLSAVTDKDCKMVRALKDEKVCQQEDDIDAHVMALTPSSPEEQSVQEEQ